MRIKGGSVLQNYDVSSIITIPEVSVHMSHTFIPQTSAFQNACILKECTSLLFCLPFSWLTEAFKINNFTENMCCSLAQPPASHTASFKNMHPKARWWIHITVTCLAAGPSNCGLQQGNTKTSEVLHKALCQNRDFSLPPPSFSHGTLPLIISLLPSFLAIPFSS